MGRPATCLDTMTTAHRKLLPDAQGNMPWEDDYAPTYAGEPGDAPVVDTDAPADHPALHGDTTPVPPPFEEKKGKRARTAKVEATDAAAREAAEQGAREVAAPIADERDLQLPATPDLDAEIQRTERHDAQLLAELREGVAPEELGLGPTELEARMEVPALALLQFKRRHIARMMQALGALFTGPANNQPAEAKRRQHRDVIARRIAAEQGITGDRVQAKLETMANADPRHVAWCRQLDQLRAKYEAGRVLLTQLEEAVAARAQAERAYVAEVYAHLRTRTADGEGV